MLNFVSSPDDEDEEELLRRAIAMSLEGTEEKALVSLNGEEDFYSVTEHLKSGDDLKSLYN